MRTDDALGENTICLCELAREDKMEISHTFAQAGGGRGSGITWSNHPAHYTRYFNGLKYTASAFWRYLDSTNVCFARGSRRDTAEL